MPNGLPQSGAPPSPTERIVRVINVGQIARGLPVVFNALPGIVGTPGPQGPPGDPAYTTTANTFVVPAVNSTVTVTVGNTDWMVPGQSLFIHGAGYYTVSSLFDATHVIVINPGSPGNAISGTVIAANSGISPAGSQGATGPTGSTGPQGPIGPAGPQGTGITWMGSWSAATAYSVNQAVTYGGSSYVAVAASTGVVPGTDATKWQVFAAQGATGATGSTGATGPAGPAGAAGTPGPASTSNTTANFSQPAVNGTVTVTMGNTTWMPQGSIVYIVGGGYYEVQQVLNSTQAILLNTGYTGNAAQGTVVNTGSLVSAGGVAGASGAAGATGPVGPAGPNGTAGVNAYSVLQAAFAMPQIQAATNIQVDQSTWMSANLIVFIPSAGYFQITTVISPTAVTILNLGYTGNASPGTTIASGSYVYPAGAPQVLNREYYATDFENGWGDWAINANGANTGSDQTQPVASVDGANALGVARIYALTGGTSIVASLGAFMTTPGQGNPGGPILLTGNNRFYFHTRLALTNLSNVSDRFIIMLGLGDNPGAGYVSSQNAIFFYYTDNTLGGSWGCYSRVSNTQYGSINSGVALAAQKSFDLACTIDNAFATFSIGQGGAAPVQVGQIPISQLPLNVALTPFMTVYKTAGSGGYGIIRADSYEQEMLFSGAAFKFRQPAMIGPPGQNAYTGTTAAFTTPAVGSNVTVTVQSSLWIAPGQTVYIQGAGAYQVMSVPNAQQISVQNLGSTGNVAQNTVINAGSLVSASGVAGPQGVIGPQGATGPQGAPGAAAYTTTTNTFNQPSIGALANVPVGNALWMTPGQVIYIAGGGYYTVSSVPNQQNVSVTNLGYAGNVAPGTVVNVNEPISPGGIQGSTGGPIPTGTVLDFAGPSAPVGFLMCDGSAVSRATYGALYTALGGANSPWGQGDGSITFNLPDLRSRVSIGAGQGSGLTNRALAAVGGVETVTLLLSQIPSHTHPYTWTDNGHNHQFNDPSHRHQYTWPYGSGTQWQAGSGWGFQADNTTYSATGGYNSPSGSGISFSLGNSGGGGGHENMPPFVALNKIVKT